MERSSSVIVHFVYYLEYLCLWKQLSFNCIGKRLDTNMYYLWWHNAFAKCLKYVLESRLFIFVWKNRPFQLQNASHLDFHLNQRKSLFACGIATFACVSPKLICLSYHTVFYHSIYPSSHNLFFVMFTTNVKLKGIVSWSK